MKDEWGIVLDFLPRGRPGQHKQLPIAQVLGERYFSLLEVVIRPGITVYPEERIYIGDGKRKKVKYIKRSISVSDLTAGGRAELELAVEKIVKAREQTFVNFFNEARPLTTRMHQLEILPGIGKKRLWEVLDQRKAGRFTSYEDLKKRLPLLPNPIKMFTARILEELKGRERYNLFVLSKNENRRRV
jgi:putative nucleotide binding protein